MRLTLDRRNLRSSIYLAFSIILPTLLITSPPCVRGFSVVRLKKASVSDGGRNETSGSAFSSSSRTNCTSSSFYSRRGNKTAATVPENVDDKVGANPNTKPVSVVKTSSSRSSDSSSSGNSSSSSSSSSSTCKTLSACDITMLTNEESISSSSTLSCSTWSGSSSDSFNSDFSNYPDWGTEHTSSDEESTSSAWSEWSDDESISSSKETSDNLISSLSEGKKVAIASSDRKLATVERSLCSLQENSPTMGRREEDDRTVAASRSKKNKVNFKNGGGRKEKSERRLIKDREDAKDSEKKDNFDKVEKGKHGQESRKSHYDKKKYRNGDGKHGKHHDETEKYGKHHDELKKGHEGTKYAEKEGDKKEREVKGYNNKFRKDELHEKRRVHDDLRIGGHRKERGEFHKRYSEKEGKHKTDGLHKSVYRKDHYDKKKKSKSGRYDKDFKGYKSKESRKGRYTHKEKYNKKGGYKGNKRYGSSRKRINNR